MGALAGPRLAPEVFAIDIEFTLKEGASAKRAWNRPQLTLLGVPWPPVKGWKARLIRDGFRLTFTDHQQFVALRTGGPSGNG